MTAGPARRLRAATRGALAATLGLAVAIGAGPVTDPVGGTPAAATGAGPVSGPFAGAPAATARPTAGLPGADRIDWGQCSSTTLQLAAAMCGTLTVPRDHAKPDGPSISLAVSMVRHKVPAAQYRGVMIVNPGGPGASGLSRAAMGSSVPGGVGARYDWIGFDPRGVGFSEPAVSCDPNYFAGPRPDYRATTPALQEAWLERTKAYAKACAGNGELLRHLSTEDSARDVDAIRAALGAERINYYGFSYGTYLGQVYATLFPDRLDRVVLDGVIDPRNVWYAGQLAQDVAFERAFEEFFGWIARYDSAYRLGASADAVAERFHATRDALAAEPAGDIGSSEWTDAFLPAGYSEFAWPLVADAFAAYVNDGDIGGVQSLYERSADIGDDNGFAMYLATQCTDARWPDRYRTWRTDAERVAAKAPLITWQNLWFNAACLYWPAPDSDPVPIDGSGIGDLLLISGTLDAATPYAGALAVRQRFPGARLIATPGQVTHSSSLTGNACVDNAIAAYLGSGELPPRLDGARADLECEALPRPLPFQQDPLGLAATPTGALVRDLLAPTAP